MSDDDIERMLMSSDLVTAFGNTQKSWLNLSFSMVRKHLTLNMKFGVRWN